MQYFNTAENKTTQREVMAQAAMLHTMKKLKERGDNLTDEEFVKALLDSVKESSESIDEETASRFDSGKATSMEKNVLDFVDGVIANAEKEQSLERDIVPKIELPPVEVTLEGLAKVSKSIKKSVVNVGREELRFLVDAYYQAQDARIAAQGQLRAVQQGYDEVSDARNETALWWLVQNKQNEENQLKNLLNEYVKSNPVGVWCSSIMGIGPVIAASMLAYFDISKCNSYNQFWSYAGLNDNINPWLGKAKADKWVDNWIANHPDEKSKNLSDNIIYDICEEFHRPNFVNIKRMACDQKKLEKDGTELLTEKSVKAYLAKPPYNKKLKTQCWKIGESFLKVKNKPNSLYGKLLTERIVYEKMNNDAKAYADQAARILETTNVKDKKLRETLESGRLSDGHILLRCKRWATKIFIAHLFEAMYYDYNGQEPPVPYTIAYQGHKDYIYPEVDYHEIIDNFRK